MAKKFKFKGHSPQDIPSYVKKMGPILGFRFKLKNGTVSEVLAPGVTKDANGNYVHGPNDGFKLNGEIDVPEDERALRHMRKHKLFDEVILL